MAETKITSNEIQGGNYSTSEQDTGTKWINGKTIYKKTLGATGNIGTAIAFAHNVTGIESTVDINGYTNVGAYTPIGYYVSATNYVSAYVDSTNLNLRLGTERAGSGDFAITIYYTKV